MSNNTKNNMKAKVFLVSVEDYSASQSLLRLTARGVHLEPIFETLVEHKNLDVLRRAYESHAKSMQEVIDSLTQVEKQFEESVI